MYRGDNFNVIITCNRPQSLIYNDGSITDNRVEAANDVIIQLKSSIHCFIFTSESIPTLEYIEYIITLPIHNNHHPILSNSQSI